MNMGKAEDIAQKMEDARKAVKGLPGYEADLYRVKAEISYMAQSTGVSILKAVITLLEASRGNDITYMWILAGAAELIDPEGGK